MNLYQPTVSGSLVVSGSIIVSGSLNATQGITASFSGNATSASFASSVGNLNQNVQVTGSLGVTSTITAQTLNVQTVTSSVVYSSGSNIFGNSLSNVQQMTGSLLITGSNVLVGTTASNGFMFKLSKNGAEEIAINPGDSANLNNYVNYNRSTSTYIAANYLAATHSFLNGNVGVGTSSPVQPLHIETTALNAGIQLYTNEASDAGSAPLFLSHKTAASAIKTVNIEGTGNGSFYIRTGATALNSYGSIRFTVDATGSVGIGTSNPTPRCLTLYGTSDTNRGISFRGPAGSGGNIMLEGYDPDDNEYSNFEFVANSGAGYFVFNSATGSNPNSWTTNARMVIGTNGRVGIGTTSPTSPLDAYGTTGYASAWRYVITAKSVDYPTIRLYATNSGKVSLIGNNNDGSMYFFVNGDVSTTQGDSAMTLSSNRQIVFNSAVYNNSTGGAARTLYIANDYYIGGISSIRASKKNIENITNVDWLYQLNPVSFNYRKKDEEGNYTEETYEDLNYGLIAEDTAPIADFLINYNNKEDGTKEMVGIEYSRLITPLLKAIQEQQTQIEELKAIIQRNNLT